MAVRLRFRTLAWKDHCLELIDQTRLPRKKVYLRCRDMEGVWRAIREMKVRGAPAIGVAAAFGVYLGIRKTRVRNVDGFVSKLRQVIVRLSQARPTARNLFSAMERMENSVRNVQGKTVEELKALLLKKALDLKEEDEKLCGAIGKYGSKLIRSGDNILTHCNAGALATAGMGTALAVIYSAAAGDKRVRVYATETRPFLQGARLTAWELKENRIPVCVVCDNMVGSLMQAGRIDKVFVGADRIARNGDTANKIGTYAIAQLARLHGIPFFVAAPGTTFDFSLPNGRGIPIEHRDGREFTHGFSRSILPKGVSVFNPAFDVTPHRLISGIITEKGVLYPPYEKTLAALRKSR